MAGTNNFLVFNEANNPTFTMSDADYYADLYRLNGLIPMIADPIAHNKMYRQWSIMISAIAGLIASMNYNASDADLATLQANLKSAIEDVAEAKVDSRITTLENWKSSITATPAEINILDGVTADTAELNILDGLTASTSELNTLDGITASTAELNILDGAEISTTELNYLSGAKSNIQTQITTLENWKSSITATPAEINILDGVTASTSEINILHGLTASTSELNTLDGITASTAELNILDGVTVTSTEINYLSDVSSNIQQQIDNLNISALFSLWAASRAYSVGDVVKTLASSFWVYLECVVTGTSDTTEPTFTNVGELVTDGTVKWLVLDLRDSAPVGTIKQDIIKRDGWLKLNGATVNVADYPRLINFLIANSLLNAYTATPDSTKFYYGDSNNETLLLPDFEGLFIENSASNTLDVIEAGLPNITGTVRTVRSMEFNKTESTSVQSLFWINDKTQGQHPILEGNSSGKVSSINVSFDASRSSSIYGNSNTVQPPAVKLIPVIKY